jgi:hypothetical protein
MSVVLEGKRRASEVEFVSEASEQSNLIFTLSEGAQKIKKTSRRKKKPESENGRYGRDVGIN